jgi:hypothetical protein
MTRIPRCALPRDLERLMPVRTVDVFDMAGVFVASYEVDLGDSDSPISDQGYEREALRMAVGDGRVPTGQMNGLTAMARPR